MKPKCVWCSGTGWVLDMENWYATKRCALCDGTGRVPIVTWIGQKIALWRFKRRYG